MTILTVSLRCPGDGVPERKNKHRGIRGRAGMKLFATELRGKTVMTEDGQVLGVLEDFLLETKTGRIQSLLVAPAESVETRLFKIGRGRVGKEWRYRRTQRDA